MNRNAIYYLLHETVSNYYLFRVLCILPELINFHHYALKVSAAVEKVGQAEIGVHVPSFLFIVSTDDL
jgi:hypothetical protein